MLLREIITRRADIVSLGQEESVKLNWSKRKSKKINKIQAHMHGLAAHTSGWACTCDKPVS